MKIYQLNLKNNNLSFKSRKKKSASFDGANTQRKSTDFQLKIELPISRSDYFIMPNGDLKCNHYREGKQIENSGFYESISTTPINSNEDIFYNPACDYSCSNSSNESLNPVRLSSKEIKAYADSLSERILNYVSQNKNLLDDEESQSYFYSLLNHDFRILNNKSQNIISKYVSLDENTREKEYDSYCERLSQNIRNKENKMFYKYCNSQKKLTIAKKNAKIYDNEEIILKKLSEHKDEIEYLWSNVSTMTSMFKGTFNNFIDISQLPCCCCGMPLTNEVSVEHIRPHSLGKNLTKNTLQNQDTKTIDRKFNSPRNFIFEHKYCNGRRGNTDFKTFIESIDDNFADNTINNINCIVNLIKSDKKLSKSLRSYGKFVKYNLKELLFFFENKPKIMQELLNNINNLKQNEFLQKDTVSEQLKTIFNKYNIKNMRLKKSLSKELDKLFNTPKISANNFSTIYKKELEKEKEVSSKPILKKIEALLKSNILDKIMTKAELDEILFKELELSDETHSPFIKEIKYLYNEYCILKYYPPVISKTIYRETGGKINVGLSSWANLMYEIEDNQQEKPIKKVSFYSKHIKPIGNYIASLFSLTQTRVSGLPRI